MKFRRCLLSAVAAAIGLLAISGPSFCQTPGFLSPRPIFSSDLFQGSSCPSGQVFFNNNGSIGCASVSALSVSGISGGIPYFNSATTQASTGQLGTNQIIVGGGPGVGPSTPVPLGTTTQVLHGNPFGAPSWTAITSADISTVLASPPPFGSVVPNTVAGTTLSATGSTTLSGGLLASSNPSFIAALTGNAQTTDVAMASNGTTSINGTSQAQAIFGLTSNKGTGQSLVNSNNLTLYSGMECQAGSRQCWAFNALTSLRDTLSGDFVSATTAELDYNNFTSTNFNSSYGSLSSANIKYVGPLLLTGSATNNASYAIGIGGLNTTTGKGSFNRGIEFINSLGAVLADIQSDDISQSVLADFGSHSRGIDLNGIAYSQSAVQIRPSVNTGVAALTISGTYTVDTIGDSSVSPYGIFLGGTYATASIYFNSSPDFHYAGTTTCTNTGSISVKINGSVHAINYC